MKYRYNELTKRLLNEGYTAEHYPDYVTICKQPLSAASRAAFPGQSGPY